jgi:hypothetical protein
VDRRVTWAAAVRIAVGIVGLLAALGGFGAIALGEPIGGLWALVVGGVLLGAAFFEKGRYRAREDQAERPGGSQPTNEVFVDPTTGERIRVWFDPNTGFRRYEPDR